MLSGNLGQPDYNHCLVVIRSVCGKGGPSESEDTTAAITYVDDASCPSVGSGTENDPYCNLQTAVNNAPAESEIHVAEGIYRGVHTVTATNSYTCAAYFPGCAVDSPPGIGVPFEF